VVLRGGYLVILPRRARTGCFYEASWVAASNRKRLVGETTREQKRDQDRIYRMQNSRPARSLSVFHANIGWDVEIAANQQNQLRVVTPGFGCFKAN
jgi:hypothetical protein